MKTYYIAPSIRGDRGDLIPNYTDDYDWYKGRLKKMFKTHKKEVWDYGDADINPMPYPSFPKMIKKKIEYDYDDVVEYEFQYKLERIKLICHKVLFDNHYIFTDQNRFNPDNTMLMVDNFNIGVYSKQNYSGFHYINDKILIPEYIDSKRYVLHKLIDFIQFDFNEYFEKIIPKKAKLKDVLFKQNMDITILINIKIWARIFLKKNLYETQITYLDLRGLTRHLNKDVNVMISALKTHNNKAKIYI